MSYTPINSCSQNVVKEKLLRDCGYNLFDPRSPNQLIMRTPMDLKNCKVVSNTNDSIASLDYTEEFNGMNSFESALSAACNEIMGEYNGNTGDNARYTKNETTFLETNFDYVKDVLQTPMFQHIQHKEDHIYDVRSPTVGVKRTPIVFSDTENLELQVVDKESEEKITEIVINKSLPNKMIELKIKPQKSEYINQKIYEDDQNIHLSTPRKTNSENNTVSVRTPLSCVANTKHMRSKRVFEKKCGTPLNDGTPNFHSANGKISKVPVLIKRQIN